MISRSCGSQYLAPSISACHVGCTNVDSCSIVGLRNSGAVSRMKSVQNWPASGSTPLGSGSGGGARSTRSSSKPERLELARPRALGGEHHTMPALGGARSPIPMQLLVGPYALSGMNRNVARCHGHCARLVTGWTRWLGDDTHADRPGDRRRDRRRSPTRPGRGRRTCRRQPRKAGANGARALPSAAIARPAPPRRLVEQHADELRGSRSTRPASRGP